MTDHSDFITERELSAHLEPMKVDIHEIKTDVRALRDAKYDNSIFGGKGQLLLFAALPCIVSGLIAILIALFLG